MKAKEFKDLADTLETLKLKNCDEGRNRTRISRYYYYIFLRLRNEIIFTYEPDQKTNEDWKSGKAHALLRKHIRQIAKEARKLRWIPWDDREKVAEIAGLLDQLHQQRKDADYELDIEITADDAEKAKLKVKEIENRLPLLETILKKLNENN